MRQKTISEAELSAKIRELLYDLKLPSHFTGYNFLKRAIMKTVLCDNKLPDISSHLIAEVAYEFSVDKRHAERAITKAVAFINSECGNEYIMYTILGYEILSDKVYISVKELIALTADQLRIKYYDYY